MPTSDSFAPQRPAFTPNWHVLLDRETAPQRPILIPDLSGRCILVTGAGGFIGSELVRILARSGAERIVLLEISEQALFDISTEMTRLGQDVCTIPVLGSVCDSSVLHAIFDEYRPEVVLHAAALKHVPLMERNPFAAIATNSVGTWLLARTAAEFLTRQMILISTDKAVAPHSIMGASKRIAELAMLAYPQFAVLRLVNVIGSPGSVAPIFVEQIARGGPVTVTDPAAQRFFMTLAEVMGLLSEAVRTESARGILVPDPGEPLLIAELARRMIVAGGSSASIVFTGPRPGDKLEESLISVDEYYDSSATASLRRIHSPSPANLDASIHALQSAIAARDLPLLLNLVKELVRGYRPSTLLREPALDLSSATP